MELQCTRAVAIVDTADFNAFCCSNGSAWANEAEEHVPTGALRDTIALAFRSTETQELVAVSSFNPDRFPAPLCEPTLVPSLHLQVVAISLEHQRKGLACQVFATTFAHMRQYAPDWQLVTAAVHREHRVSRHAAEQVGLEYLVPRDDNYILLASRLEEMVGGAKYHPNRPTSRTANAPPSPS